MADETPLDLQAKVDLALRRADLLERRIAAWERELAAVRADVKQVSGAAATVDAEADRVADLEARLRRLENRSLQAMVRQAAQQGTAPTTGQRSSVSGLVSDDAADARAVVFARWTPLVAQSGESVTMSVKVDGFEKDDVVEFLVTELGAEAPFEPLKVPVSSHEPDEVSVTWKPPKAPDGKKREFYFVARGKGQEARSPVLTVQG